MAGKIPVELVDEVGLYVSERKVYPREQGGFFQTLRKAAVIWLLGMYYGFAWLQWDDRQAAMPALAAAIGGDVGVTEVAAYVQSLSGIKADPALAAAGKAKFGVCAACHGVDGKGNQALGAPNLTDDVWVYGSDFNAIRDAITMGRNGMMPAHLPIIGETRTRLAAAYVWSLSRGENAAAGAPAGAP